MMNFIIIKKTLSLISYLVSLFLSHLPSSLSSHPFSPWSSPPSQQFVFWVLILQSTPSTQISSRRKNPSSRKKKKKNQTKPNKESKPNKRKWRWTGGGNDEMGMRGAHGLSPCQLWVVANEMGKRGACGLSPTKWVVTNCAGWCWVGWQTGRERGEDGREFGLEGKGRRLRLDEREK